MLRFSLDSNALPFCFERRNGRCACAEKRIENQLADLGGGEDAPLGQALFNFPKKSVIHSAY